MASGARLRGSLVGQVRAYRERLEESAYSRAAGAGALVFYDEMRIRAPVDEGTLQNSIYRYYDKDRSTGGRHVYVIAPNKAKAPHWHLIEYGHYRVNVLVQGENGQWIATKERLPEPVWVPAVPYIRPTYDAKAGAAIAAARKSLGESITELQRK